MKTGKRRIKIGDKKLFMRLLIVLFFCIILVGISLFRYVEKFEERSQTLKLYEQQMEEQEKGSSDSDEEADDESGDENVTEGIQSSSTFLLENVEDYATPILGENVSLLNEKLQNWIKENQISCTTGELFYAMIPEDELNAIVFFAKLNDADGQIVSLSFYVENEVVSVEKSSYTEEEILNEAWNGDVPSVRDSSVEELEEESSEDTLN